MKDLMGQTNRIQESMEQAGLLSKKTATFFDGIVSTKSASFLGDTADSGKTTLCFHAAQ
ncbi:hypothetical protein [Paenibacillus sp. 8b26]|uniref:hypothetical protein n=1 Tax=Paenibacillus sp. 8b26 TaxID=3424133 RepID=UPI003D64599F